MPSITFMKNSASEIFCLNHQAAYQHAFRFIRQLAIHLRNSMKLKTKVCHNSNIHALLKRFICRTQESYKQVYNWQYVHAIDFWSLVLARACEVQGSTGDVKNEDMRPLIYPLVQIATGAIKYVTHMSNFISNLTSLAYLHSLISHPRSYAFHLHIIRSLIHLTKHTNTYIPLTPHLLLLLTTTLTHTKSKASTLRPLDFETTLRVPQQYINTHVYAESLVHEAAFLTAEWLSARVVHSSIAFPELVVPIVASLRRSRKVAHNRPKVSATVKVLVERIEESARWASQHRTGVSFAPGKTASVGLWEAGLELDDAPLIKYARVLRKTRDKQRELVEKVHIRSPLPLDDFLFKHRTSRPERARMKCLKSKNA